MNESRAFVYATLSCLISRKQTLRCWTKRARAPEGDVTEFEFLEACATMPEVAEIIELALDNVVGEGSPESVAAAVRTT